MAATTTIIMNTSYPLLFIMLMVLVSNAAPKTAAADTTPEKLGLACVSACQEACSALSIWEQVACYAGCDLVCAVECEETLGLLCKGFPNTRKLMSPATIDAFKAKLIAYKYNNGGKVNEIAGTNAFKTEP